MSGISEVRELQYMSRLSVYRKPNIQMHNELGKCVHIYTHTHICLWPHGLCINVLSKYAACMQIWLQSCIHFFVDVSMCILILLTGAPTYVRVCSTADIPQDR